MTNLQFTDEDPPSYNTRYNLLAELRANRGRWAHIPDDLAAAAIAYWTEDLPADIEAHINIVPDGPEPGMLWLRAIEGMDAADDPFHDRRRA